MPSCPTAIFEADTPSVWYARECRTCLSSVMTACYSPNHNPIFWTTPPPPPGVWGGGWGSLPPPVEEGRRRPSPPPAPLSRGNRRGGRKEIPANAFFLDPHGSERKTTGSYYTHPSLVNELIKSALLLVARDRLAAAGLPVIEEQAIGDATAGLSTDYAGLTEEQRAAGEAVIPSLKVRDPAAGSDHFLVKANNVLGAELARIRSGDKYPTEAQVQAAKRDVGPLHLRGGPEPDGGGTVQGEPVDQRQRAGCALPRAHLRAERQGARGAPVRQHASRGEAPDGVEAIRGVPHVGRVPAGGSLG